MPPRTGLRILLLPLLLAASLPAVAQDRCEGTLCDLYYGGPAPEKPANAPPAAPKPLMAPTGGILGFFGGNSQQQGAGQGGQAAPTQRMIGVGGGGLAALARGEQPDRCTGTLCDLYYGGPPKEKPAAPAPGTLPTGAAVDAVPTDAPPPEIHERLVESREAPTRCVNAKDPWSCYRK